MTERRKDAARANRSAPGKFAPVQASISRTIADADNVSLKRLAWAYGCAPKGSSEEKQLEELLRNRVLRDASVAIPSLRAHLEP